LFGNFSFRAMFRSKPQFHSRKKEKLQDLAGFSPIDNQPGCLTSLAVFQAKALQNCSFSGSCSETEVSEQL
jgi:hypothetical protein